MSRHSAAAVGMFLVFGSACGHPPSRGLELEKTIIGSSHIWDREMFSHPPGYALRPIPEWESTGAILMRFDQSPAYKDTFWLVFTEVDRHPFAVRRIRQTGASSRASAAG
jgi:hypothetical protein